ncbi:DNA-binding protein BIN4 isoform X2 [Rhododendron vialii]|uniref:DNA-binding protein BIN4 isoform X2 n=1 Tax=Rhododendron vialii TaxID=182163 RepID=UPI00265D9B4F|nr:DNA-binding protein BIN4 isoform X2 [Rhododendron vialii]
MSDSREESPDWLRAFEAPTRSVLTLSSGSEASPHGSPLADDRTNDKEPSPGETSQFPEKDEDDDKPISILTKESSSKKPLKTKSPTKQPKGEQTPAKKRKTENGSAGGGKSAKLQKPETNAEPNAPISSVWTLSSDSESPSNSPIREALKGKSPKKGIKVEDQVATKKKSPNTNVIKKGNDGDADAAEEEIAEKNIEPRFSSSRLPLVLSEKVSRTKALVECDGESIDLSGDVGAVGRVVISDNPSGNHDMFFDLKGTIYKTAIVPSRTFCVVSFGQSEAKVEAIMNDFIQLTPQSNVYEAETMVEGTLEGYSFDSDDDADKVPKTVTNQTDQNEDGGEQSNIKPKSKKAEKASGVVRKQGKAAVGKPPKKPKKKTQAPKKSKTKK